MRTRDQLAPVGRRTSGRSRSSSPRRPSRPRVNVRRRPRVVDRERRARRRLAGGSGSGSLHGSVVGWGWLTPRAELHWMVADGLPDPTSPGSATRSSPGTPSGARGDVATTPRRRDATVRPSPRRLGRRRLAARPRYLTDRGWTPADDVLTQYHQPLDLRPRPAARAGGLPASGPLRGPEDIPARVEVHRAAFAPSRMTVEKYEIAGPPGPLRVRARRRRRGARRLVRRVRDGLAGPGRPGRRVRARRRPSGPPAPRTRPGRRCATGFGCMRAAGMRDAIVFSLRTNAASEALYRAAGLHEPALHRPLHEAARRASTPAPPTIGAMTSEPRGDPHRARLDGRDGGPGRRAVRRLDPAGRPELPDLRPAVPAAVHPGPRAGQAGRGRDERRARPARAGRRRRRSRRRPPRWPTARTTTSSRSTSTRPAPAPRRTRT